MHSFIHKLSFVFLIGIGILFSTTSVFAQEKKTTLVSVSQVNVEGARIVDKVGSILNISFVLSNRAGIQSDVRYSVRLVSPTNSQIIYDEKPYEEVLTLAENTAVKKSIIYEAPTALSGKYTVVVTSSNSKGFSFGSSSAGEVTLGSENQWLSIDPSSCELGVLGGGAPAKAVPLTNTPSLQAGQTLSLSCIFENKKNIPLTLRPVISHFIQTLQAKSAEEEAQLNETITIKPREKKRVRIDVPVPQIPQEYLTQVAFTFAESNDPLKVFIRFRVEGSSLSISKISLDKDVYKRKENAQAQIVWAYKGNTPASLEVKIESNRISCGKTVVPASAAFVETIAVPINRTCIDPVLIVTAKDAQGKNLLEERIEVKTLSEEVRKEFSMTSFGIILFLVGILVITLFARVWLRKKQTPPSVPPLALSVVVLLSVGLIPSHAFATFFSYSFELPYTVIDSSPSPSLGVDITATPNLLILPQNQTVLSWTTTGSPDSCTASTAWSGTKSATGGTETITGLSAGTYLFDITCTKGGTPAQSVTDSALVVVQSPSVPSGTLSGSDCLIPVGGSTCASTLVWTTANLTTNPTLITRNIGTPPSFTPSPLSSGSTLTTLSHGQTRFYLYHNSAELSQITLSASCAGGSSWNGTLCQATPPVATATLIANPTSIISGGSSLLTWNSTNTSICSGSGFSTGGIVSGSVSVSPLSTTTYTVTCTGSGTAVAQATVTVSGSPALPECSDGIDNADPEDILVPLRDEFDPGCHTDGNVSNPLSYDPNDPSENDRRRPLFKEF